MHCIIHIDGGARGNPGPAGAGVLIVDADTNTPLVEAGYFLGRATNNVAEYQGLLHALQNAAELEATHLDLHSDSQLMVRQIHGQYKVKSPDLKPLHQEAIQRLKQFERWTLTHVLRDKNKRADELANMAMDTLADARVTG